MLTWDDTVWVYLHSTLCWDLSLTFILVWRKATIQGCGPSEDAACLHPASLLLWASKFQMQTAVKWEELHLLCVLEEHREVTIVHFFFFSKTAVGTSEGTQISIVHLRNLCSAPKTCHNTSEKFPKPN